jgi:hypothetical protein
MGRSGVWTVGIQMATAYAPLFDWAPQRSSVGERSSQRAERAPLMV